MRAPRAGKGGQGAEGAGRRAGEGAVERREAGLFGPPLFPLPPSHTTPGPLPLGMCTCKEERVPHSH